MNKRDKLKQQKKRLRVRLPSREGVMYVESHLERISHSTINPMLVVNLIGVILRILRVTSLQYYLMSVGILNSLGYCVKPTITLSSGVRK